ncbi:MAG: acetyl-CoA carboxylase biotin carboxyl carrier protein [Chlamydiota bacterium]
MKIDDIQRIMKLLEESKLEKMVIKHEDFELHLEKPSNNAQPATIVQPQIQHEPQQPAALPNQSATAVEEIKGSMIESPMVGTFYASPGPDQAAFVKVGDKVSEDTVVCIVEAMKVMNEVKAGISGVVQEILVDNAEPVEYGTPLFRVT